MTDVFFSYSSKDRERVRPIRDAPVAEGFDVFWDQEVPPGRNWDEWIRQHLDAARCTIVFWSEHSVRSDNVVHEATVAKNFQKLIPVLLDPIASGAFPMGHYTTQGLQYFAVERGAAPDLRRLVEEVEAKATRRWMRRRFAELEGRVKALNTQREQMEDHEAALHRRVSELEVELELSRRERTKLQSALAAQGSAEARVKELESALKASQLELETAQSALHAFKTTSIPKANIIPESFENERIHQTIFLSPNIKQTERNIFYWPRSIVLVCILASAAFFSENLMSNLGISFVLSLMADLFGLYMMVSTTFIGIKRKNYAIAGYGLFAPLLSWFSLLGIAFLVVENSNPAPGRYLLGFLCIFLSLIFYLGLKRYGGLLDTPKSEKKWTGGFNKRPEKETEDKGKPWRFDDIEAPASLTEQGH